MIQAELVPQVAVASNASLTQTLLDGVSLYGISAFDRGRFTPAMKGASSEGLIVPYGQGVPAWGDFQMFSNGVVGQSYEDQWDLTGSSAPTTYSVVGGALPDGLLLQSVAGNTGRIYGTPTAVGTFNFTLRATNQFGSADKAFSITIVAAGGGGAWTFLG